MRGISRLAHELGLSTGTVSRALNNVPGVHEKTRHRVLEAAQRLGYEPNQAARTLALGQTKSIGFMIDLDPDTAANGDNFFMGVFDGVQSVLTPLGLDLLVLPCPSKQHRFAYLDRIVARRLVDGMILSGTERSDARIDLLQSAGLPFVALGRSDATKTPFSWVDLDFESVATSAVDRLVSQGHRRIAVTVPFGDLNFGIVFREAYRKALARHRLAYDADIVFQTGFGEEDGYFIADAMLDNPDPVTAVVLIFEAAAIGIYRRLEERSLQPGRDLAVIGFRDEAMVRSLRPRLTRYEVSLAEVGSALANALLGQMNADRPAARPTAQVKVSMTLLPGESDPAPAVLPRQKRNGQRAPSIAGTSG
ncbi:MAG: substrate-binding domain-containing protein [Devosia sp.]|nr:substrate-binding domain-containing protein [Devosia sp.]